MFRVISIVMVGLLTGCASINVAMMNQSFPPRGEADIVDVYNTQLPEKKYLEIAELTANASDNSWNIKHIIGKAKELGADGVILRGSIGAIHATSGAAFWASGAVQEYGLKAIAIKYK